MHGSWSVVTGGLSLERRYAALLAAIFLWLDQT
jgi:hypothetical protein